MAKCNVENDFLKFTIGREGASVVDGWAWHDDGGCLLSWPPPPVILGLMSTFSGEDIHCPWSSLSVCEIVFASLWISAGVSSWSDTVFSVLCSGWQEISFSGATSTLYKITQLTNCLKHRTYVWFYLERKCILFFVMRWVIPVIRMFAEEWRPNYDSVCAWSWFFKWVNIMVTHLVTNIPDLPDR